MTSTRESDVGLGQSIGDVEKVDIGVWVSSTLGAFSSAGESPAMLGVVFATSFNSLLLAQPSSNTASRETLLKIDLANLGCSLLENYCI